MKIKKFIEKAESNPKIIFLIDGLGAGLTAFMLGVVLVRLEHIFGIPPSTLYFLALIPILYVIYDIYCYNKAKNNLPKFIKGIAVLNLIYCFVSLVSAFYHRGAISMLGWVYVIIEIIIIIVIASIEYKISNKLTVKQE